MAAISVTFTPKVASDWDPQKPLTTTKLNQLYNNTTHLREWLGASYTAGAEQNHNHDGLNSALLEVGANLLRNGSFESDANGWTITEFTGGTAAVGTYNAMHGVKCMAFTSTVLANGGGSARSNEYIPVAPGRTYSAHALFRGTTSNLSSEIGIVWYDSAKSQISGNIVTTTDTTTTATLRGGSFAAPGTAAYARVHIMGGVPSTGSATGTVYVDGCMFAALDQNIRSILYDIPGTYTFIMPAEKVLVAVQGAGGGNAGGYSGGAGGYVEGWVRAPIGTSITVTVGAGAAGNSSAYGGTSSFGSYMSATGGRGTVGACPGGAPTPSALPTTTDGITIIIALPGKAGGSYVYPINAWWPNTGGGYVAAPGNNGILGGGGMMSSSTGPGNGGGGFVAVRW